MAFIMKEIQRLPFQFLALPPELRNLIYADILTKSHRVNLPQPWVYHNARCHGAAPPQQRACPRLLILQVSKQVYREAKQILYKRGTFLFVLPSPSLP